MGRTLPGAEQAARVLGALGLSRDKRIVLYDDSAVKTAARAWFILTGYGFDEVAILDGGLAKWQAEGRPLESGTAKRDQPLDIDEILRPEEQQLYDGEILGREEGGDAA